MVELTVRATELPELEIVSISVRRGHDLAARAHQSFGMTLPLARKWLAVDDVRFVCVTPGQWLAVRDGGGDTLLPRLMTALGDAATLIDLSGSRVGMRISGAGARDALAKLLPLDLHARVMQPGDAAATVAAHLPILVWQHDAAPTYDLLCPRSLAGSFHRSLELTGL